MALLARNADRLFWAARYLERAEDTARLVQQFSEVFDDLPSVDDSGRRWAALLAVCGDRSMLDRAAEEREVVHALVTDPEEANSVVACVAAARANLRSSREVLPREAWQTVNDLSLFVDEHAARADGRRFRGVVLGRVADDSRRLDGIITSSMSRTAAYEMWRIGRYLERADMTTRVVGVRAASLMVSRGEDPLLDRVQWMSVLRSLSALQMYQRSVRGPIEASLVVKFLLYDDDFPRSVSFCLEQIRASVERMPNPESVLEALDMAQKALGNTLDTTVDGADLDNAMDSVQLQMGNVNEAIAHRYFRIDSR